MVNGKFSRSVWKFYTGRKNLHWRRHPRHRQLSGMDMCWNQLLLAGLSTGSIYFLTVPSDHTVLCESCTTNICVFERQTFGNIVFNVLYHYFFKNISHVRPIWNFDRICICVFVFLCICICMSDNWEHCFWCPRTISFLKI